MAKIDVTPEVEEALARAVQERGCSVTELLASTFAAPSEAVRSDPFVAYTLGSEFRAKYTDADRYIALLGWVAKAHPEDFSDFIEHQESGRRYLGLTPEEIRETCRHNQARQIPGSHFWAIMNLDTPTKRRFLRRLLVFVGMRDDVITHVLATIGARAGA